MTLQIDERHYEAGWDEYSPGEPAGDPVDVNDDYRMGWWCGVGNAAAWHAGWEAAEKGVMVCPYRVDADDECFREPWYEGYFACVTSLKKPVLQ